MWKKLGAMFGGAMTASFESDCNDLDVIFTLSVETLSTDGGDLTDAQGKPVWELMQQQYDGTKDSLIPVLDMFRHLTMKSCAKWQNFLRKKNTYANAGISTRFLTVSPAAMISLP